MKSLGMGDAAEDEIKKLFDGIDAGDKDGKIDFHEFKTLVSNKVSPFSTYPVPTP